MKIEYHFEVKMTDFRMGLLIYYFYTIDYVIMSELLKSIYVGNKYGV